MIDSFRPPMGIVSSTTLDAAVRIAEKQQFPSPYGDRVFYNLCNR